MLCLDEQSGEERWRWEDRIPRARKLNWLFRNGLFVMNDSTGRCTVLLAADGKPRWQRRIDGRWSPGAVPFALDGDRILFRSDHGLMAVSAVGGRVLWRTAVLGAVPWRSMPVLAGGLLVASAHDEVVAVDARTGRQRWRRKVEDAGDGGVAALVSGEVVVACGRSPAAPKAVFLRLSDGRPVGEIPLGDKSGPTVLSRIPRGVCIESGDRVVGVAAPAPPVGQDNGGGPPPEQQPPEEPDDVQETPQTPPEGAEASDAQKEPTEEKP